MAHNFIRIILTAFLTLCLIKVNLERFETIKIHSHELINNKVTPMAVILNMDFMDSLGSFRDV